MLYLLYRANHADLAYQGGQAPIVHLEADLYSAVAWAEQHGYRWAFTLSNAGAYYFEDRANLAQLGEINWGAIQANRWSGNGISGSIKEGKQAEFLVENSFPWALVSRIGVHSRPIYNQVREALHDAAHQPPVEIKNNWYY